MHFPMRCLRSDSQRAGRAAVTGALGGAAEEVDERRHGAHVAWRKCVDGLQRRGFICRRGISWKDVDGFVLRKVITRSISAAIFYNNIGAYSTVFIKTQCGQRNASLWIRNSASKHLKCHTKLHYSNSTVFPPFASLACFACARSARARSALLLRRLFA